MGEVPAFEDIEVGKEVEGYEYWLTPGRVQRYIEAVGDPNPWYGGDSPFGGPIAPATICDNDVFHLRAHEEVVGGAGRTPTPGREGYVHAKQEYQFLSPARAGKKITVKGWIADKYLKRDREYVTLEALSVDEDGREILRSRATLCWYASKKEG